MEQLSKLVQIFSNIIFGENLNYSFLLSIIFITTAIIVFIAVFKFSFLFKEHYYSGKFLKKFRNTLDFEDMLDFSELYKDKSILADCFFKGFETFYSLYKINTHYQSGSTLELSKRKMEIILNRKISSVKNYSFFSYVALMFPGLAISSIIYNYAEYIEIHKSFDNIDPIILVDSLRLFFISIMSSLFILSIFFFIDKYLENRFLNFKNFIDEYAYIIHKSFYTKESDIS